MTSRPTISKFTIAAVLPPQWLLAQFESGFVAKPSDKMALQALWEKANKVYKTSGPPSRSYLNVDDVKEVDDIPRSDIESALSRIRLYAPYDSHTTGIHNVRISKLVTPQIVVNLSRAEKRATLEQGMKTKELFPIMFESAGKPEPITKQTLGMAPNGGALMFTSYDEDIRLHHPPEYRSIAIKETDNRSPSLESVCLPVGGGLPFASANRIQIADNISRLILNNGIHRVYRLAQLGYEWCPLAVCDLVPLELPDPFVDLPKSVLLDPNSNPPLITDFLDNSIAIPLEYYTLLKSIRLNWNFEQYVTVLK